MQIIIDETSRLSSLVTELWISAKVAGRYAEDGTQRFFPTAGGHRYPDPIQQAGKEQEGYQILFEPAEECNVSMPTGPHRTGNLQSHQQCADLPASDKTVTVTQTVEGGQVRIAVHDSGQGIPQEERLPLIWNRYYRSKENHKRAIQGSGLGLHCAARRSGGAPRALWRGKPGGTGTTFWFIFARRNEEQEK